MYLFITMKEYSRGDLIDGLIFHNEKEALEHPKSLMYFLLRNYKIPQEIVDEIEHLDSIEAEFDDFVRAANKVLKEHDDCVLVIPLPYPVTFINGGLENV